jgi:phosphopentomutase
LDLPHGIEFRITHGTRPVDNRKNGEEFRALHVAADHNGCGWWRLHEVEDIVNYTKRGFILNSGLRLPREYFLSVKFDAIRLQRQLCEQLYEYCRIARKILKDEYAVGRVIARPFIGEGNGNYTRTPRRHDFSLEPTGITMLDQIKEAGMDVIGVGKIKDIFAGVGITEYVYTQNNAEGIDRTLEYMDKDFHGLCFTNLVDTDMIYGHRRDIQGYGDALSYFDKKLGTMLDKMRPEDLLIITADHGCDPGYTKTTDHTREYVPFVACGAKDFLKPGNYGVRESFADLGATVLKYLGISQKISGASLV